MGHGYLVSANPQEVPPLDTLKITPWIDLIFPSPLITKDCLLYLQDNAQGFQIGYAIMVLRETMTNRESVPGANRNNNCGEDDPEDPYAYLLNQVGENQTILDCITATYFFELFYPNKCYDPIVEPHVS